MDPIPDQILSNIIDHTVDLHRYEANLQGQIRDMLTQLANDLVGQVAGAGLDTPRTAWQRSRLEALLKTSKDSIDQTYGGIASLASGEMQGLIQVTSSAMTTAMNDAIGSKLMVPVKWTPDLLSKLADNTLIQGAPSAEWWSRQSDDLQQAFADQMRQGMLRGESVGQLRDRILGQGIPGVGTAGKTDLRTIQPALRAPFYTARRNAEALVRTSVITTANQAHMAAFEANADLMAGVEWCATLDNRTCLACAALDGRTWGWAEGHPVPSLHWGCRCCILPVTKTWEQLSKMAGGNSALAKRLDQIEPGQRASLGGPISGKLRYEDWFNAQSDKRKLEIMGPGKLELYKAGNLGFTDMIDQKGNPLTLAQLAENSASRPTRSEALNSSLATIEKRFTGYKVEHAAILDQDGNVLLDKKGQAHSVSFLKSELDLAKDNVMTHNHPLGQSLSPQDLFVAVNSDLAEMRAATSRYGDATYYVRRPDEGWPKVGPLEKTTINRTFTKIQKDVQNDLYKQVSSGAITADEANKDFVHKVWLRLFEELNLDFGYGVDRA